MSKRKSLNRRSFMSQVAGGAILAGGATSLVTGEAHATRAQTGVTDHDSGALTDAAGYGRGTNRPQQPTGISDYDSGVQADAVEHGRGATDSDASDAVGRGRGNLPGFADKDSGATADSKPLRRSGLTDNDAGANADRGGDGRGAARTTQSGVTDSDEGALKDRAGFGRGEPRTRRR